MFWGKADAKSESSGSAVFNADNGYAAVLHMDEALKDEVGTITPKDAGSTSAAGIIGQGRHLTRGKGINGGDRITNFPYGDMPFTSEVWFRAEKADAAIFGWGRYATRLNGKTGDGNEVVISCSSPPRLSWASDGPGGATAAMTPAIGQWYHVAAVYSNGTNQIYVNGRLEGSRYHRAAMSITTNINMTIGGLRGTYQFSGDIDEVRVSRVARSADSIKLEYENQKSLQTLVGPVVQAGNTFSVSPSEITITEGESVVITAQAGGAQKVYWILKRDGAESVVAVDRFNFNFNAGRVAGDQSAKLEFKAVFADGVKIREIPITIREEIQEPVFTLKAPKSWNGRSPIEVVPQVANLRAMQAKGAGDLKIDWKLADLATIKEIVPGKLLLKRAQNSGKLTVTATVSNGGPPATRTITIAVTEPKRDAWVSRVPARDEKPVDGQFYARDDKNEGTLFYNGTLEDAADSVFIKVYADDKLTKTETAKPAADKSYALSAKLKPGLIKYRVEFGTKSGGRETVLQTVTNLVCGDAYIIEGQSNALATDTGEKSPTETNEWIRSYGRPPGNAKETAGNLWCYPVWKAQKGEKAELGWWGMELAKRLVESQKMPIFIVNGAVGGTRIDQHQRNETNSTDLTTIYGRMLWRVQQAKLTHGIRGILWHQGENNQGTAGPTGDYDWKAYEDYFIEMSGAWKQDFPNLQHTYVFQIWPNSCSMAGNSGAGDMIREIQRSLPGLYSHMSVMSTLGIKPPGGCHFPLVGWAEFARLIQPLIERDNYGRKFADSITPPNLRSARFTGPAKDAITLEFDQPIVWNDTLTGQFYLDGEKEKVASGALSGNVLTLKLKEPSAATKFTYVKESAWSQDKLVIGANRIAALSFCNFPISEK